MSFTPLHDRVVVRRLESEEKTAGGLIIPDSAKEKPAEGEVVSVGAGARDESGTRISMDIKAGDKVLFGKWSGTEVTIDNVDYVIVKESDIMTVGIGNGPVNAIDSALRKALIDHFPSLGDLKLTDYKVMILSSDKGTGAITRVLIESSDSIQDLIASKSGP